MKNQKLCDQIMQWIDAHPNHNGHNAIDVRCLGSVFKQAEPDALATALFDLGEADKIELGYALSNEEEHRLVGQVYHSPQDIPDEKIKKADDNHMLIVPVVRKPCQCAHCNGGMSLEEIKAREAENMRTIGWYCHSVSDAENPTGFDFHTHGFTQSYGVPDIQVILPLDPKIIHDLTCCLVEQLKQGLKITDGMFCDKIISKYKVLFKNAKEDGRPVLRMILPDKRGCLTADAEGIYAQQWDDLE